MYIRSIHSQELKSFVHFSTDEELNDTLENYIQTLWDEGTSQPAYCFAALENDRIVGRVVYWAASSQARPTDIDFFDVDWNNSAYLHIGFELFQQSLDVLAKQGVQQIIYQLNEPNNLQPITPQRLGLLQSAGFFLRREGYRWESYDMSERPQSHALHYKSSVEVEEQVLFNLFKQTLTHSLDRGIQHDLARWGIDRGAHQRLERSRTLQLYSDGWQVAYTESGAPVGLIFVARNDGGPIIDYVGVLPEQRGYGYVHDIVAQGVHILLGHGATRVRTDCDISNAPMIRTFQRAGFVIWRTRKVYMIELPVVLK